MQCALLQNNTDSDDDVLPVRKRRSMVLHSDEEDSCNGFDSNLLATTPARTASAGQEAKDCQSPLAVPSLPAAAAISNHHSDSNAPGHCGILTKGFAGPCNSSLACAESLPTSQTSPRVFSSRQRDTPRSRLSSSAQSATSPAHDVHGWSVSSGLFPPGLAKHIFKSPACYSPVEAFQLSAECYVSCPRRARLVGE